MCLLPVLLITLRLVGIQAETPTTTPPPDFDGLLCPSGMDVVRNGECRGAAQLQLATTYREASDKAIELCAAKQAFPISIHDEEDFEYWDHLSSNNVVVILGIVCNTSFHHWQWADGSPIDYKPEFSNPALNQECSTKVTWYLQNNQMTWYQNEDKNTPAPKDFYCISDLNKADIENVGCLGFSHEDSDSMCYQISQDVENWYDAQKVCKLEGASLASIHSAQENSFIRRLAISQGHLDGLLLGASLSGKSNNFSWLDGSDWDYTNFVPGFPIDGLGSCLAMATNDIEGQWTNMECSEKLPFACSRKPFAEGTTTTCLGANVNEGDLITSPGYPTDASIPCDFFLKVNPGKIVEVEVILLEANSCCDHLVLSEGSIGGNVIANLTGAMGKSTFRSTSSNVMRASWQPHGGVNVRGMMITFHGV